MTDVELEQAAMAPHRWIRRCATLANQHSVHCDAMLRPTSTRIIQDPLADSDTQLFFVPGGRYLLSYSLGGMGRFQVQYLLHLSRKGDVLFACQYHLRWRGSDHRCDSSVGSHCTMVGILADSNTFYRDALHGLGLPIKPFNMFLGRHLCRQFSFTQGLFFFLFFLKKINF